MEANITGFLAFTGCGAALCILWFFLALRGKAGTGKSAAASLLTLALGTLLGAGCARLLWMLFMMSSALFLAFDYDRLSYYGGMAGVILAVALAAKACRLNVRETLNTFAPMGALLAAVVRFAEYFLGEFGCGDWMEEGVFFPVTVEFRYGDYSEFYWAVFMLEGLFAVIAMVLALVHHGERYRWVRTVFYLCLPQVICESLRINSIAWGFIRAEEVLCFLLCEGVLVWYALKAGPKKLSSWVPALTGLLVCGVVVAAEFAKDGKIMIGGGMIPAWIVYGADAAALAVLAFMEHRGYRAAFGK